MSIQLSQQLEGNIQKAAMFHFAYYFVFNKIKTFVLIRFSVFVFNDRKNIYS